MSRSFNRWLVRYIYVPLGGAKAGRRWNVFVVFIFVALWHDVEAKLFLWGLLNGVFLVLEGVVRGVYSKAGAFERCRASSLVNRYDVAVLCYSACLSTLAVPTVTSSMLTAHFSIADGSQRCGSGT